MRPHRAWHPARSTRALAFFAALATAAACAEPVPLANPGFEDGQTGWVIKDKGISAIVGEAAHSGKFGLRLNDESPDLGSDVACARFNTEPGKKVTVRCWARYIDGDGMGVYLRFYKGDGSCLNTQDLNNEIKVVIPKDARDWRKFGLTGVAPEEAIEGEIWIRSWSHALVKADLDDFELEQSGQ